VSAAAARGGGAGTRRWFAPIAGVLTGTAWLALFLWEQSPYGRYLDHPRWTDTGLAATLCSTLPAGDVVLPALPYAGGWLLMTAAMMLPTALPLFRLFDRMVQPRPDHAALMTLLVAGYLLVWAGFGVAAHLLDAAVHAGARQSEWLMLNGWAIGTAMLAGAGLFQFSRLKYHCLDKCRTPYGFIAGRWQGPQPWRSALRLGLDHGLYCVGCCWAIMLLMFVVGTGNVGWMLGLGAIMAVEKNMPWGRHLSRPLGRRAAHRLDHRRWDQSVDLNRISVCPASPK